jgi:tetratricopeptide (TPR) repeat protein
MHRCFVVLSAVALMLVAPLSAAAPPEEMPEPESLSLWNDPTFQKHFLGSYGFNAELEPRISGPERESLEEVLELMKNSDEEGALRVLGEILEGKDQRREETTPSALFDFIRGNIHFQREELEQAARDYENALEKFPSFLRAYKNLGLIQVRLGDYQSASETLSQVIELGGGDGLTYGLLGYSYSSTEQHVSAESAFRSAMLLEPKLLDWKLGLTHSVLRQGKYEEAATLCEELLSRYPDRTDFWNLQANAYIGLERPLKAAENFEVVRRMGKATVQTLDTLGDIYINESLWDLAANAYADALELDPEQSSERPLRNVEVLAQRNALSQAKALLDRVKQVYEGWLDLEERKKLLKLEARIVVAEGGGGDAAGVLEEIVALDPLDGEALILLGQHYARMEQPEQAIFYYERAESLEGHEADAKIRHAQLLVDQSRYREAVPLLKRALELEPREDISRYLEQVERVARTQN